MRKYKQEPYTVPPWIYNAIQVLRPVERLTVSEWAAKYRVLPDGNAIPGPWSNSVTPYLVEIMDAFSDDMVEEIVFVKPTQVGGTSAMENMLGSLIAQDPAPAMVVYPSDDLAERTTESKLEPMVKSCKVLADKWRKNDSKKLALKFSDMTVYLTGANSPADLASTNIRYLFLDEVDKFPGASKKEADPVSLARERTKTFFNRKIFMASPPTLKTGHIWKAKEAAEAEKHYFVPCPHCGQYIELKFGCLKWPSKDDVPENTDRAEMAVYVCQACGAVITDQDKGKMLRAGRWQAVKQRTKNPKSVAFWLNTLYSPFTRFSDIARVDIMDAEGEFTIPVRDRKHLEYDIVGDHLKNYDFMVNLAHFKGHAMGGFGGVIKNQSIGVASAAGKAYIHSAGKTRDVSSVWNNLASQDDFLESMAASAQAVADYFGDRILYINVMNNLSIDCDCDSHPHAPEMKDIGILASLDPVALDQACLDLVYAVRPSEGNDNRPLVERIESRHGRHTVEYAEKIGLGSRKYELKELKPQQAV